MERKEPTLGGVTPDETNDANSRRPRAAKPTSNRAKPQPVQAAPSRMGGLALLIAVAALGGSGYLAWQLQMAQESLVTADQRIVVLEQKLELSDDESTQSLTALQAKLKEANSEIRKLWGVAYDTNRKQIASNKSKISGLDKGAKSLKSDIAKTKSKVDGAEKQANTLAASLKTLSQQVSTDKARYDSALGGVGDQRKQIQNAVDDVNRLKQQLAKLNLDLTGRVKNTEEAIDAIDKHRLTINRELLQLKQQQGGTQ
jgi:uncharacterized protein HemX